MFTLVGYRGGSVSKLRYQHLPLYISCPEGLTGHALSCRREREDISRDLRHRRPVRPRRSADKTCTRSGGDASAASMPVSLTCQELKWNWTELVPSVVVELVITGWNVPCR